MNEYPMLKVSCSSVRRRRQRTRRLEAEATTATLTSNFARAL